MNTMLIGVVIPCYNEALRLPSDAFIDFVNQHPNWVLCFVNDGSRDNTAEVITSMKQKAPEQIWLIDRQENKGKGESIREGMNLLQQHPFKYIGFLDADLATPLSEMERLVQVAESSSFTFICASRVKRMGGNISRLASRHLIGRFFATLISWSLRLPFYDTQCGAKVFRRDEMEPVFNKPFMSRWLVDVEIIKRFQLAQSPGVAYSKIYEYPLNEWIEVGDSKIRFSDTFRIPLDLLKIHIHYKVPKA
jgi:glycosyltransferase involved in cell wall biosynthesis